MVATQARNGQLVVISGPSGAGKSSIVRRLLEDPRVEFSVSATTRERRAGEVHGRHYWFLTKQEFKDRVRAGEFIEFAEVHGNMYGTLRAPMEDAIAAGRIYLIEIDVQGGSQLQALDVPGLFLFIAPPDFEELRRRLRGRGTESPEVLERRLKKAEDEYRERVKYDHVVVNDDFERALGEVRTLIGLDQGAAEGTR